MLTMKYNFENLNSVKHEFIYEDAMIGIVLKRYKISPQKFPLKIRDNSRQRVRRGRVSRSRRNSSMTMVRIDRSK